MTETPDLATLAALVAAAADAEVLPRFGRVTARGKADGSLVTETDLALQERLRGVLGARWPEAAFLAEEMPAAAQQAGLADGDRGVWCLDPLDGTTNYAAGFPYFAVSLAWIAGGQVRLGVVYDPVRRELYAAQRGRGATLNGAPLRATERVSSLRESVAVVDFKRLPADVATRLATRAPFRSQRNLGAVALDWSWLAAGRFDLYLHGAQRLWDYGAGRLVFAEAGGASCLLESLADVCDDRLTLAPRMAVAAASPALRDAWLAWLRGG
jgi:myo-inositol-1(or 4)-monophosphatase